MRDECFIRGSIPMTKSEVRAVSLSKMELCADSIVYDVGAGTGSVTVEAARMAERGQVYAFEQKDEGCELIRENCRKHGISNVTVISGKAPESMIGLDIPAPDCAFVGGSGGKLSEILDCLLRLNPAVRIVINVIALESLCQVMECLKERGLEPEVVSLSVARGEKKGHYHLMQGQNPVYILTISGENGSEKRKNKTEEWEKITEQPETSAEEITARIPLCRIPRIMIAAPESGSGKTVLTTGLLALFKRRGLSLSAFKCGPDYIDPMFHRYVQGMEGCNLDSFFLPENEVQKLFVRQAKDKDLAVIEGVMGYYDGVAGSTVQASAYDIARITGTPVILVLDGRSSSLSLAAQVHGFQTYRKDSRIAGVILNRTSEAMLDRLRPQIEALGVACLGCIPVCGEAALQSRHLGLTIPEEQEALREKIELLADRLEQTLDVDRILQLADQAEELPEVQPDFKAAEGLTEDNPQIRDKQTKKEKTRRRMGVARDEVFCFYYQENLDFLQREGWELVEFSPLHDGKLPENLDGILLGGGYPESYARELSENTEMLKAVKLAAETGKIILAECGGFLYLHRSLEGTDGVKYPMADVIQAEGFATKKLSRFGYISLTETEAAGTCGKEIGCIDKSLPDIKKGQERTDGSLPEITDGQERTDGSFPGGTDGQKSTGGQEVAGSLKAHEFHYWDSTAPGKAMTAVKPASDRSWSCMYRTETMLAGFPHLYYLSAPDWMREFLKKGMEAEPKNRM